MAEPKILTLPSGRALAYGTYGSDAASAPFVFYHHGFPSSHAEAGMLDAAARAHGLRLVAADRPGLGASAFQRDRRILDWPADLLALADHLRADRFAVLAISGGCPYVLACWREIPRARCVGAAVVSGLFPAGLGTAGMMLGARMLLWVGPWLPGVVASGLDKGFGVVARDVEHPDKFEKLLAEEMKSRPEVDREVWETDEVFRKAFTQSVRAAMQQEGGQGAAWEPRLSGSDWGFKLEDLEVRPGQMIWWHGGLDNNVPAAMAEKAAKLVVGVELRMAPEEGHISIVVRKADEIMDTLKRMLS